MELPALTPIMSYNCTDFSPQYVGTGNGSAHPELMIKPKVLNVYLTEASLSPNSIFS